MRCRLSHARTAGGSDRTWASADRRASHSRRACGSGGSGRVRTKWQRSGVPCGRLGIARLRGVAYRRSLLLMATKRASRLRPTQHRHGVENSSPSVVSPDRIGWLHTKVCSNIGGTDPFLVLAIDVPDFTSRSANRSTNSLGSLAFATIASCAATSSGVSSHNSRWVPVQLPLRRVDPYL